MGFENVESIFIDNKEVQSIVVKDSGGILFQKSSDITDLPVMTLTVTHSSFETYSSTPFVYTGKVFVDWGDNTGLIEYTGGKLSHSFTDGVTNHTVRVYGELTSLEESCFEDCIGLTSISIPSSVTSLKEACLYYCTDLTSVTLPDSVISIGNYCFGYCDNLTKINIPDSVISLGNSCFRACSSLTSISISNSITILERDCFWDCTGLTSIVIPNSVTSLENSCFGGCTSLTQINIPNNIINLEDNCFYGCSSLTSICLNWTANNILIYQPNWITDTSSNLKFRIPFGTTSDYLAKGYPSDKLEEAQPMTLWAPQLNGETGANYVHSYSESNGEAIGKGFVFKNGFDNINGWELSFEFKHDNIQYTGICFLTDLASGYKGREGSSTALTTWEGSWPGGSAYATYKSGEVGYFDVTVTKIDSTHVRLQSETLNRDTTVEVPWLESATKLSFGARHNVSNGYGPCRIRNVLVKQKVIKTVDVDDDGEIEGATIEPNP